MAIDLLPKRIQPVVFIDRDQKKHGHEICGIPIVAPEQLWHYEHDCILITSMYANEIRMQLHELGIQYDRMEVMAFNTGLAISGYPWDCIGRSITPSLVDISPDPLRLTEMIAEYKALPVYCSLNLIKERTSMLHTDVLMLLWHFSRYGQGAIVEVGPYLGGSTIAMGVAMQLRSRMSPLITVEAGGKNEGFHFQASNNIVADLRKNIMAYGLDGVVDIVEGRSNDAKVIGKVKKRLNGEKAGLLFLDADGEINRDLSNYLDIL